MPDNDDKEKEEEYKQKEITWKKRGKGAFWMAALIVILDVGVIALGVADIVSVALSVGCVGVITFVGVLMLCNYLSHDPALATTEMRKAIAAAFTLVYLVFLGLVVFTDAAGADTELAKTIVGHFTWIEGIIIIFYFGSRAVEKYIENKPNNK
ncbi:MAG: hypothetical protein ABID71_09555 [Chloroflexota bacterium]